MAKVYIAGHNGMLGKCIHKAFQDHAFEIVTVDRDKLDLTSQLETAKFIETAKVDLIILSAAKVGGVGAITNNYLDFVYQNSMIELNVINSAALVGVNKLIYFSSSCIFGDSVAQPIQESEYFNALPNKEYRPYAIAKILGTELCIGFNQMGYDYKTVVLPNLYGLGDNFNSESSHVIPALIKKIHEAKINNLRSINIWGSPGTLREFINVHDVATAVYAIIESATEEEIINVGPGEEIRILDLARMISDIIGYEGDLVFDETKPVGVRRKILDNSKIIDIGWRQSIELKDGLEQLYFEFIEGKNT